MDINEMKALPYDEMRALYKIFLHNQNISQLTINTAYTDTFYLWRKGSKDLFWNVVTSTAFENTAKKELIQALSENSTGNAKSLANGYLSHLRRFRLFLASDGLILPSKFKQDKTSIRANTHKKKMTVDTEKNFYSFTTKYCSHHNPLDYPIYDSYVDEVLRYFRNRDSFSDFQDGDLKDYIKFKGILIDFRSFYGLDKYNLKQIDQYIR